MSARLAICAVLLAAWARPAWGQNVIRDDFEGPETSLRDPLSDANAQVQVHRRVQQGPHSGRWCEQLSIRGENGTYVYLSHPIGAARVIGELTLSVWLKSDRGGLQLLARVVLPRSNDPRTGKPLTTLIRGPDSAYKQVGAWQQLHVENLPTLLERQVRVLRAKFGPDVDAREAYVDRLLLNVYGGPGTTNVWVDDLEVAGMISAAEAQSETAGGVEPTGPVLPLQESAATGSAGSDMPAIEFKNPLLLVGGKPFFLRSIDYQGEPLSRLQSLGFNAVRLKTVPPPELLREAGRLGLWLIAPPPAPRALETSTPNATAIGRQFDAVLAWNLGTELANRELEATKRWARLVQTADPRKRPLFCDADSDLKSYTRPPITVLLARRDPLGTTLQLGQYAAWLRERSQLVVAGTPFWAAIQTELSPKLADQMALFSAGRVVPGAAQESQIRMLIRTALTAGARGLCFESVSRLDAGDAATRRRAAMLELLNMELELAERWPAAGNLTVAAWSSEPHVSGGVIETDYSRLLIPVNGAANNQFVMGNPAGKEGAIRDKKLTFRVSGVPEDNAAWELTPTTFRRLPSTRVTGGTQVVLGLEEQDSLIVFTQDAVVVQKIKARVEKMAPRAAQLTLEVAKAEMAQVQLTEQRLTEIGRVIPASRRLREEAEKELQEGDALLKSNSLSPAYYKARLSLHKVREIERAHWDKAQVPGAMALSDPFNACLATLPEHYRFVHEMRSARRSENRLPAGRFEDLYAMRQSGWRYYQHPDPDGRITTSVDLSPQAAHSGPAGLRLRAMPVDPKTRPALVETSPLWIMSPAVHVERGDLVQIGGWLRIAAPITGSVDGLLIIDTLAGDPMALRVNSSDKWQEFTLYRAAAASGLMGVTFALTGLGEVCLDDVTIQIVERARPEPPQQAQRMPAVSGPGT